MMNDQEISSDKLSSKVNALLIIDIQEKIIKPIFNKDSIIKNIKKLLNAYQISVSYTHLRAHETR